MPSCAQYGDKCQQASNCCDPRRPVHRRDLRASDRSSRRHNRHDYVALWPIGHDVLLSQAGEVAIPSGVALGATSSSSPVSRCALRAGVRASVPFLILAAWIMSACGGSVETSTPEAVGPESSDDAATNLAEVGVDAATEVGVVGDAATEAVAYDVSGPDDSPPPGCGVGTTAVGLDVNGDGFADVIVGAFDSTTVAGKAFVYLGGAAGHREPHHAGARESELRQCRGERRGLERGRLRRCRRGKRGDRLRLPWWSRGAFDHAHAAHGANPERLPYFGWCVARGAGGPPPRMPTKTLVGPGEALGAFPGSPWRECAGRRERRWPRGRDRGGLPRRPAQRRIVRIPRRRGRSPRRDSPSKLDSPTTGLPGASALRSQARGT